MTMQWLNEPPIWNAEGNTITVKSAPKTDFWRKTHDGGVRDTGHFYFERVTGNFTADVKFTGEYRDLYDQAGMMVRLDETVWMKCGVEFFEGVQNASVVMTHEFSDWSVQPLRNGPTSLWLRVVREGFTIAVYYSTDSAHYTMIRQAYFTAEPTVSVGVMCCAPTGSGISVTFEGFTVRGA
jgi:uncharacterized protein